MGKLIFAALFGGILASLLTFFLCASLLTGDRKAEVDARLTQAESQVRSAEEKADVASKRADLLQRRFDSISREQARALARIEEAVSQRGGAAAEGAPAGATASDGSPYVSRAELEAALAKAGSGGRPVGLVAQRVEAKTLEEIAQEMGLSASDEANVRQVLRDSEEEAVKSLFGDRPLAEIRDELAAAREDPDKMQQLVTDTIGRGFQNVGKLMTLESRTKKKVEGVLGKERAKDFLGRPRRPVLEKEYGELLNDAFKVDAGN